jgi:hypothetical protein
LAAPLKARDGLIGHLSLKGTILSAFSGGNAWGHALVAEWIVEDDAVKSLDPSKKPYTIDLIPPVYPIQDSSVMNKIPGTHFERIMSIFENKIVILGMV